MKHVFSALLLLPVVFQLNAAGQAPAPQPPATPPPAQNKPQPPTTGAPPPTTQAKPQPRPAAGGMNLAVQVTDRSGNPIQDVSVRTGGPVDRSGTTGQDGNVTFRSMRAGTYRMRFEREGFTTFEREVVMRNQAMDVSVALTAAPTPPKPEPAPPVAQPAPPPPRTTRDVQPHSLSIADYLDKNLIGSQPMKSSLLACAEGGTAVLLQLRDPLNNRQNADADELLYVVAGAGILRLGNQDTKLPHGSFALIPRGMTYNVRRDGRVPMIAISILAGSPCTETAPPVK